MPSDRDRLLTALASAGPAGLTQTQISSGVFARNRPRSERRSLLDALQGDGLVECEQEKASGVAKPILRWRVSSANSSAAGKPGPTELGLLGSYDFGGAVADRGGDVPQRRRLPLLEPPGDRPMGPPGARWGERRRAATGHPLHLLGPAVQNAYAYQAGTSMATPHVTGAVALLLAKGYSAQGAVERVLATVDPMSCGPNSPHCRGRLNVDAAVGDPPAAQPAAPAPAPAPGSPAGGGPAGGGPSGQPAAGPQPKPASAPKRPAAKATPTPAAPSPAPSPTPGAVAHPLTGPRPVARAVAPGRRRQRRLRIGPGLPGAPAHRHRRPPAHGGGGGHPARRPPRPPRRELTERSSRPRLPPRYRACTAVGVSELRPMRVLGHPPRADHRRWFIRT